MATFLYWRHKQTGELYAVRVNDAGVLDGAAGPLPLKGATQSRTLAKMGKNENPHHAKKRLILDKR